MQERVEIRKNKNKKTQMVQMNSAASLCLEHISFSFAERASSECMFTRTRIPNYVQISGRLGVGSDIVCEELCHGSQSRIHQRRVTSWICLARVQIWNPFAHLNFRYTATHKHTHESSNAVKLVWSSSGPNDTYAAFLAAGTKSARRRTPAYRYLISANNTARLVLRRSAMNSDNRVVW